MRYHYSLVPGDEPIIKDMPVYDAEGLQNGALLQLGDTDPDSNADQGISLIAAYGSAGSSSSTCVDCVGILQDSTYESTTPSNIYATNSNGAKYGKVIINPFAVYCAEYLQDTTNDVAVISSVSTSVTIDNIEDDIDGGWLYFPLTRSGVAKSLRFITADSNATSTATIDTALVTAANSTDTIIKILPVHHKLTQLNARSTGKSNSSVGLSSVAFTGASTRLCILENYISSDGHGFEPLRRPSHANLNNLSNAKFYADIVMLDHLLNQS